MSIKATPESIEFGKMLFDKANKATTTEQKHEIEIPGMPKGWKALVYGWPKNGVDYVFDGIGVKLYTGKEDHAMIIVEKIKSREITFVETDCENAKIAFFDDAGMWTYWKIKGEI